MASAPDDRPDSASVEPTSGLDDALERRVFDILLGSIVEHGTQIEQLCGEHPDAADQIRRLARKLSNAQDRVPDYHRVLEAEPLQATRTLGEYEIVREIGRGGMGVVFEAWQPSLRRSVALKVLPAERSWSAQAVERFQREGASAARIQHRGIVEVYATGEAKGHRYLAMEFVAGAPLDAVLDAAREVGLAALDAERLQRAIAEHVVRPSHPDRGTRDGTRDSTRDGTRDSTRDSARDSARTTGRARGYVGAVVDITAQVAEALDHAHRTGIVHRDVKPSNILVRPDGRAVLTDFGLARDDEQPGLTRTGTFAGTPHYASPEQARGDKDAIDERSDVFSLGATLYELITLQPPFAGDHAQQILERIQRTEPTDPVRLNRQIPGDLAAVVLKALDKDLGRRYRTAGEMAADLRAFLGLRPVTARRVSTITRARRWVRREPKLASLFLVLALAIPTISVLAGVWIANAPKVARAERQAELERIEELLTRAQLQLGRGETARAIADYRQILAGEPRHAEALAGLAYALTRAGRPDEALALLDRGDARTDAPPPRAVRRVRVWTLDALGRQQEAEALRAAIGAPQDPFELVLVAEEQWRIGRTTASPDGRRRALAYLEAALRSTARARPLIHSRFALAAGDQADPDTARQIATAIVRLWPDRIGSLEAVANALYKVAPEDALVAIDEAVRRRPDLHDLHRVRGRVLKAAGRLEEAEAAFLEAIRIRPDNARAHELLAELYYFELRRYEDCLREAERAHELDPRAQGSLWLKGHALRRLGRLQESLAAWQALAELYPDYANAFNNLADVASKLGATETALRAAQRAVELRPRNVIALSTLAECQENSGAPAQAIETLERALAIEPGDAYNWRALARILLAAATPEPLRDPARAVEAARTCTKLRDSTTAQVLLGRALAANGQPEDARRTLTAVRDRLRDQESEPAQELLRTVDDLLAGL